MTSMIRLLDDASRLLALILVASLWQSAVMTLGTAMLIRLLPRMSGRHRFNVWSAVFGFCCLLPVAEIIKWSCLGRGGGVQPMPPLFSLQPFVMGHTWGMVCVVLWVAASIYAAVRLCSGLLKVCALLSVATPFPQESETIFPVSLRRCNRGRVRLLLSDDIDTPVATGFLRPSIVLPQHLLTSLSAAEWEHVLVHEAAHLSRRDDWVALVCRLSLSLFPLNPALYYIDDQLAHAREEACDEIVLEALPFTSFYADILTRIAEKVSCHKTSRLVATFVSRKSRLPERIESILEFQVRDRRFSGAVAGTSALSAFALFTLLFASPVLVYFSPKLLVIPSIVTAPVSETLSPWHGSPVRPMIAPKLPACEREIPGITEGPHRPALAS